MGVVGKGLAVVMTTGNCLTGKDEGGMFLRNF